MWLGKMFSEKLFSMFLRGTQGPRDPAPEIDIGKAGGKHWLCDCELQKGQTQTPARPLSTSAPMNLTWLLSLVSLGLSFLRHQMEPTRWLSRLSTCHQAGPPSLNPWDPRGVTCTSCPLPSHPIPTHTKQIHQVQKCF